MAVKFIKERKKQKYLIIGFGIMLVVISIVLWSGYFKKEKPIVLPVSAIPPREIKINFEVLENPFLKELQPFVEISPFVGEKGRENPFTPY